jgi:predicted NAD/FAD-binding protein
VTGAAAPPLRIAVVGGGIAGLAAAWWLRLRARVTLFERHAEPGFVAHAVALPGLPAGGPRVDVPLRVFYPGYYPTLTRLYDELGVETEPVSYASTFTGADGRPYFRYRNLLVGDAAWSFIAPQDLLEPRRRRIALEALRFRRRIASALARDEIVPLSIGEFAEAGRFAPEFVQGLLLPAIATICTCPYDAARRFPAAVIARYLLQGLMRQSVRRARDGADDVARRLVAGLRGAGELRCGSAVMGVIRRDKDDGPAVLRLADGAVEAFDHVVLATQADHALALLEDASDAEAALLGRFVYRPVRVAMHADEALLPARRADWSAVNLRVTPAQDGPESTIWINAVMPALRGAAPVFQTVQPQREPRADRMISEARFARPVVDLASERALGQLAALHADPGRRVWFCGSYAQAGIPLLESAVRSAWDLAGRLGGRVPAV